MATQRILRDLKRIADNPIQGVTIEPINDNVFDLKAILDGPEGTPYAGGKFAIEITFPTNFPLVAPTKRQFLTKIYHPNVTEEGQMCKIEGWKPSDTVAKIVEEIYGLLVLPNLDVPLNNTVAEQYRRDPEGFKRTAAQWTQQYATGA
jgi:ubiquitin-conjugating enzyme E2 D/E